MKNHLKRGVKRAFEVLVERFVNRYIEKRTRFLDPSRSGEQAEYFKRNVVSHAPEELREAIGKAIEKAENSSWMKEQLEKYRKLFYPTEEELKEEFRKIWAKVDAIKVEAQKK